MANSVSPLFVQVFPASRCSERLVVIKLEIHFQSPKKSGGGECDVRVKDREKGVYSVWFQSEEVKNRVKAHRNHSVEVGGVTLDVRILPDLEMTVVDPAETAIANSLARPVSNSLSSSSFLQFQDDFKNKKVENCTADGRRGLKKIFLDVSATLNTDLLAKEERDQVLTICPTLKIDRQSRHLGVEKVVGEYDDIEKLHRHFEKLYGGHHSSEFSKPAKKVDWDEGKEDWKGKHRNNLEELASMEVPSSIFEYFSQAYKEQMEELEEKFSVKLTRSKTENGITFVQFVSAGAPSLISEAQQNFVMLFQKIAGDLQQETVPFIDTHAYESIKNKWKNIIVKNDGDTVVLQGPAKEVSAAKAILEKMSAKEWVKHSDSHSQTSGFEVDAALFEFLKARLRKEIEMVNRKFCTRMEVRNGLKDQLKYIHFMPQAKAFSDQSSQASESFLQTYLEILAQPYKKTIPLKGLTGQKRKLKEFFPHLENENPRITLTLTEHSLVLHGLPEYVDSAEKHIMKFLNTEVLVAENSGAVPIPSSSVRATSGASSEPQSDPKQQPYPFQEQSKANQMEGQLKEKCSICLDIIHQKEVLPKCKHAFCANCIQESMKHKPVCPVCNRFYGKIKGNQPPGSMTVSKTGQEIPGHQGCGTINISYVIPDGIQTKEHPHPGKFFCGTTRKAYLPDNKEGREVLELLKQAFDQKLIFTVGQSRTTGMTDVVTWNDIHHKTSIYGGQSNFGYPDPEYLKRVRQELKAKGIQ